MLPTLPKVLALLLVAIFPGFMSAARVCNNSPLLCDRPYNNITYLGAHDSPFVRNASNAYTIAGDQFYTSITQLSAGVRLLTGQVHAYVTPSGKLEWHLCHTICQLYDDGLLSTWLAGINRWLDRNPDDVVTILLVNSDSATAGELGRQFSISGIDKYAYTPPVTTQPTTSWPTLNQMIASNKRLVVFMASLDPTTNTAAPYLLDEFTFAFENNYDNKKNTDFSCDANRPSQYYGNTAAALASGRLPLMNHFLYRSLGSIEVPAVGVASHTNAPGQQVGMLGLAGSNCTKVYGSPPTFVLVDFFNEGPSIETVDRLNGVVGHVSGRKKVSTGGKPFKASSAAPSSSSARSSTNPATQSGTSLTATGTTTGTVTVPSSSSTHSAATSGNFGTRLEMRGPFKLLLLAVAWPIFAPVA